MHEQRQAGQWRVGEARVGARGLHWMDEDAVRRDAEFTGDGTRR